MGGSFQVVFTRGFRQMSKPGLKRDLQKARSSRGRCCLAGLHRIGACTPIGAHSEMLDSNGSLPALAPHRKWIILFYPETISRCVRLLSAPWEPARHEAFPPASSCLIAHRVLLNGDARKMFVVIAQPRRIIW
jgi:hypothetical protein